jgi:hypothetical protein
MHVSPDAKKRYSLKMMTYVSPDAVRIPLYTYPTAAAVSNKID